MQTEQLLDFSVLLKSNTIIVPIFHINFLKFYNWGVVMSTKIAISGDLGSGKSTIGRLFEQRMGFKFHSGGSIFRLMAQKYSMTPAEFSKYSEIHPEVDEEIDGELVKICAIDEDMAIDS